ncbi:MAG: heparan-alpha-glucosaminide N-acetyltransferase domain-containing protein [Methylocystis sp.]|nr:heparan-alpha-glucosaminide N-acetyltransferase domain-containing protein [Methylocystis sp.]
MNRAARRLPEIDRLRGLVIVLMALDHMRDFFDADSMRFASTDLNRTYPLLFFTRLVTHLCAPTFALLAGAGAYLYGARIQDRNTLSRFLASRGLWLILLDAVIVSPIWTMGSGRVELGTLWAIGCGLITLAATSRLPPGAALASGAVIIAGHNLLDGVHAETLGALGPWWRLLHEPGALPMGIPGGVLYPALPWIGVVLLGYGIGPLFARAQTDRDRSFLPGGAASLALFVALRFSNLYGDPRPWSVQRDDIFTLLSFLNVSKYPPSLDYLLLTLGVAALLLPLLAKLNGRAMDALATFGRTPLFFYVLHLYVGLGAALALALAGGWSLADLIGFAKTGPPENFGFGLAGAYLAWIAAVLALYPLCVWFDGLKSRRPDWWWLSYL